MSTQGGNATLRILKHIRGNLVAYLALLLALSGTANALNGTNTVTSDDIAKGEVKRADVGPDAIATGKIGPEQVGNADIGGSAVDGSKVIDGSLTGSRFGGNSLDGWDINDLTGSDIQESTFGEVATAKLAGRARNDYTPSPFGSSCDPGSTTYVVCGTMDMNLPANGRLLLIGAGNSIPNGDSKGTCALYTSQTGGFGAVEAHVQDDGAGEWRGGEFQMSVVTEPLGPVNNLKVEMHCNQTSGDIEYYLIHISAVQIGPS